ncbi:transcription termination factor Rho [Streptomyces sp. 7N604]|uniref:transcription termination factor Rho n=1 Tax=Streptomyces sp. 7N604 TaxID=3457415 RepID=UPI003FD00646
MSTATESPTEHTSPQLRPAKDEAVLPFAGVVDLVGQHAYVRADGYLPGARDLHLTMNQVRRLGLRKGDFAEGTTRPGHGKAAQPWVGVDKVNGIEAGGDGDRPRLANRPSLADRPHFADLTPLHPQQRLRLETAPGRMATRVIDLVAPVGKGQRGLIVAPPKTGKTVILQELAEAVAHNHPECHLMVVLLDERPEEVTDMQRSVRGEVLSSTFDRPAKDHAALADLAIERAKRLVELGHDVVILLDSLTRLCRAHNNCAPGNGRILTGGVDSSALLAPKRLFGAARNIENGGSLTILATALVETGSRADDYYFEELKSTGNMELRLDRALAEKRIFPAIDVDPSGTRREEILTPPGELAVVRRLRRALHERDAQKAIELLLDRMRNTGSNAEFLHRISQTGQGS